MTRFRLDRSNVAFSSALALVMLALLIGPRIPDAEQTANFVYNVHLPGPFGLSLNSDSREFLQLASEPAHLFDPGNVRQSRPGLIFAAAILSWPLLPLSPAARWFGVTAQHTDIDPERISSVLASYPPAFVAYVLLNVAILMAAFYYYRRVVEPGGARSLEVAIIMVSVGLLLIANDVVKVFLWSPHTQMFNILVPILGVYIALRAGASDPPPRRFAIGMGLATGLGVTAYAFFAVLVPCFVVPSMLRCIVGPRARVRARLIDAVLFSVLAAVPFVAWYVLVRTITGSFYQVEIATQVVWMEQAYSERGIAGVITGILGNLGTLGAMAAEQSLALCATIILITLVAAFHAGSRSALRGLPPVLAAAVFVSVLVAGFYASVGNMSLRLAYPILPPLIVATGFAANAIAETLAPTWKRILAFGCLAITIVQIVAMILKFPPLI